MDTSQKEETKNSFLADSIIKKLLSFWGEPPTSSLFRLYFLSFFLWNSKVFLYLFFDKNSMGDKLRNIYEFVHELSILHFYVGGWVSMFVCPLFLHIFIVCLVGFGINRKQRILHEKSINKVEEELVKERERANVLKKRNIAAQKQQLELNQEETGVEVEEKERSLREEFESFILRKSAYSAFIVLNNLILASEEPITFVLVGGDRYIAEGASDGVYFLKTNIDTMVGNGLILISSTSIYHPDKSFIDLTAKGKFFYELSLQVKVS